jgi:hypothetical protein
MIKNMLRCSTNMDQPNDFSVYVLIPYSTLDVFADVNSKLLADNQLIWTSQMTFPFTS